MNLNPLTKVFVFLLNIVGFFLIPLCFVSLFIQLKLEDPVFYCKVVDKSDLLTYRVVYKIQRAKLKPSNFKYELSIARKIAYKATVKNLNSQISLKIEKILLWLKENQRFPSMIFELRPLKHELLESVNDVNFENSLIADFLRDTWNTLPSYFDLSSWIRFKGVQTFIKNIRPYLPTIMLLRYYVPAVSLVFLFLFLFTTFQVRPSFYFFSTLLATSGIFWGVFFAIVLVVNLFYGTKLFELLIPFINLPGPAIDKSVLISIFKYLTHTLCIQMFFASACQIVISGLFYMSKKPPRHK